MINSFVGFLVIGVLGVVLTIAAAMAHDHLKRSTRIPLGLVGVIMALVAGTALVQALLNERPLPTPSAVTPTPTASGDGAGPSPTQSSPSATESPSPSETDTPSPFPTTPAEQETTRYYLAELYPSYTEKEGRPGRCTGGCTGFRGGSARIKGVMYPKSFLMSNDGDGRRSVAKWNTARSCSDLQMTVGLNDSSAPTEVTFTVSQDGREPVSIARVALSQPEKVTVSVADTAQVEVAAYVSGRDASPVNVVLGDAVLTCDPGSLDR